MTVAPYIHIDPPRTTCIMTAWLEVGNATYRAYSAPTDDPAAWLAKWEENWLEVAADLWDYEPPTTKQVKYIPAVAESILDVLGLRPKQPLIRRRI